MFRLRPIVAFVLGSALLPACVAPSAKPQMTIKPFVEIRHAADGSAAGQYELGQYYQARGNLDLALRAYVQALTLDSRHLEARNAMATIYSQQGRFSDAESTLREAVAQNPDTAYLRNNLGYIYYLRGNHEDAIKELRTAISLDPKNEWARNNLETAHAALDRRIDSLAERAETSPAQASTTVAPFEIWGKVEGSSAAVETTASAGLRTVPENGKPIVPDGTSNAEGFTQIETASASSNLVIELVSSNDQFEPRETAAPLVQLEGWANSSMQTPVAAVGGK